MTSTLAAASVESAGAVAPVIPVDRLTTIGVVVRDARATALRYAQLLGIDRWRVHRHAGRRVRSVVRGRRVEHAWLSAEGSTPNGAVSFTLVQPLGGQSIFAEHLAARGEGIHHIAVAAVATQRRAPLLVALREVGVPLAQSSILDGLREELYLDTRRALGGYHVRLVVPLADDAADPDEVWDLGARVDRPAGVPPLHTEGVQHLGVVVRDVVDAAERHGRLLGIPRWRFVLWEPSPDRLVDPEYAGRRVEHAYLSGMAFGVRNFGFELVQPTFGPSDYREDFLAVVGEGIHHLNLVRFGGPDELETTLTWLRSIGVGVRMGSTLRRGLSRFLYLDTRPALGWQVECVLRSPEAAHATPLCDFAIDLEG